MQQCSLQHWTLLPSSVTATTEGCFCFGSASSVILELFLYSFPVVYWALLTWGVHLSESLSFGLFILLMGLSRQEYESGLPFPSPVDHILSELSTVTRLSWVVLHGMAHSFIELDKAVVHVTMKDELPRSVGAQYATGEQWRNNSRKKEETEPKQKQHPIVDVTGDGRKVQCCKEQYCIGTWTVRFMNQGKMDGNGQI